MTFVHNTVKRIVHGCGSIKEAANEAKALGGTKALIVTDPGLAKLGVHKVLEETLLAGGLEVRVYGEAELEPSVDSIAHCADAAKAFGADIIFGFGGGSALDTTKACAVLLTNEGTIDQYFGMGKVKNPLPPMILVPTTAGTGSEMTSISVLADTCTPLRSSSIPSSLSAFPRASRQPQASTPLCTPWNPSAARLTLPSPTP